MVQVTRLAHVGLQARSLSTQAEFYNDRWGLERIDEFGGEMFFRADGPDHHVLTLTEADQTGLHHLALQVPTVDDIDRALRGVAGARRRNCHTANVRYRTWREARAATTGS